MKQKSITRKIASLKKKTYLPIKQRLEQIIEVSKEAEYAEDVAEEVGISITTLREYSFNYGIEIPPFKNNYWTYISYKRVPKRDRLIKRGLTLKIIAEKTGVCRERVRQYILGTKQHKKWKQSKKYYKAKIKPEEERKNAIRLILSQIDEIVRIKSFKEDKWAYEKTEDYFRSLKKEGKFSFETIFNLLKDYHEIQEKGEKKSIDYFAEKYNLWRTHIGIILKVVGLPTLCNPFKKKRIVTPKYKKQCLERAIEVEMPLGDISYFLELPYYTPSQFFYYYKGDKKRPRVNKWIKQFGNPRSQRLAYHDASQIYEALDCGFSCQEITDSYNISQEIYDYAIEARGEISEHIINSLRIMFPNRKIKKPYREFRF